MGLIKLYTFLSYKQNKNARICVLVYEFLKSIARYEFPPANDNWQVFELV